MTINYSSTSNNLRARLPFGVPLEDIFRYNDLHPSLKVLFTKTYHDITLNRYPIEEVLSKLQGTIAERLVFKEIIVSCKPMPAAIPPGVLLWILRHFLGLLPLPLLPDYANGQHFSWKRLAQLCKRSFMKYVAVEVNNRLLIYKLAEELSRLPPAHLLLFSVMLNFIRALSREQHGNNTRNFNRLAAYYLVKYFSSSIFLRPYNPGRVSKLDRHYFPLLLYLVLKWPAVKRQLEIDSTNLPNLKKSFPDQLMLAKPCRYSQSPREVLKIKDSYAQTDDYVTSQESSEINFKHNSTDSTSYVSNLDDDYLETASQITIVEQCNFLRDTGCQTEDLQKRQNIETYFLKNDIRCCCKYGTNYESSLNESEPLNKHCQTICSGNSVKTDVGTSVDRILLSKQTQCDFNRPISRRRPLIRKHIGTNTENLPYYGWIDPYQSPRRSLQRTSTCSPQTFVSHNDYIYDDYTGSTLNLIGNFEEAKSLDDEDDTDVLGRIAKIGWTYTPPRSTGPTSPLVSPSTMSKTALKDENYTIYYDNEKELSNKEVKENCSSHDSLKSKQSIGDTTSTKSKKSFSVANIKSKLDFLKIFSGKKGKLKGTCSFDEISNIKYKKMNSVRSTMF